MRTYTNDVKWVEELYKNWKNEIKERRENITTRSSEVSIIFLAGAPWCWKTEFVDTSIDPREFVILDPDKIRAQFSEYTWDNAPVFQRSVSQVMDRQVGHCIKNNYRVVIDGTFWNWSVVDKNIQLCIKYRRIFSVVLIYQNPLLSFAYTKIREQQKTRKVPLEDFVCKFYLSIDNYFRVLKEYSDFCTGFVGIKDINWNRQKKNLNNKEELNSILATKFKDQLPTEDDLRTHLKIIEGHTSGPLAKILESAKMLLWMQKTNKGS